MTLSTAQKPTDPLPDETPDPGKFPNPAPDPGPLPPPIPPQDPIPRPPGEVTPPVHGRQPPAGADAFR